MSVDGDRGVRRRSPRFEREDTDIACPEGCPNPNTGGMQRITVRTGRYVVVETHVPEETETVEETRTFLKCPTCGWSA